MSNFNPTAVPVVWTTVHQVREYVTGRRRSLKSLGVVPTMGALHAGHLSLAERSRRECDATIVTIFVNPKQFGPREDLAKYPRVLNRDLELLAPLGIDGVFAPSETEMYPPGFATTVDVSGLTDAWEGARRPGHFHGVTTVVAKLLNIVAADRAYFGQKDYQQLLVVRRMVADLNLPSEIVPCPIVREPDGLAMSSRNAYLSPAERQRAAALHRGLCASKQLFDGGERDGAKLQSAAENVLREANIEPDYVAVVDAETLAQVPQVTQPAVMLMAAKVGPTRLIDNLKFM